VIVYVLSCVSDWLLWRRGVGPPSIMCVCVCRFQTEYARDTGYMQLTILFLYISICRCVFQAECARDGGHLAVPETLAEQLSLEQYLTSVSGKIISIN
jgi:hypothetical protein